MGNTKPTNSKFKKTTKPAIPKKKAAPAWIPVYNKDMNLTQYAQYGAKRVAMADTVANWQSQFKYGHNYTLPETDCGHYIQTIENNLGDKSFPNYVPDQVAFMKKYGSWSSDLHGAQAGDFVVFSANQAAKDDDKDLHDKYAHIGIVTAVDTLKGIITLMNSTRNGGNAGTLKPGYLSMKTGERTDPGWQGHNGTFVGLGRMYPFIKDVQDSTGALQSFNTGGNNNSGQPVNTPFNIPDMPNWQKPKTNDIDPGLLGPVHFNPDTTGGQATWPNWFMNPAPAKATAAPDAPSYWNMPQPEKYNGPYLPTPQDVSPIHNTKKSGKSGGGGAVNNITIQTNHTHNNQSVSTNKDISRELFAILTSAVADSKIGTDLC